MALREIVPFSFLIRNGLIRKVSALSYNRIHCCRCISSTSGKSADEQTTVGHAGAKKAEKISMAMKAYLERTKAHEEFMDKELQEYEIGKRHLANIMGEDPDNFSQEDIDEAIQYLLPSGLFDKKSRPLMKHPKEVIPMRKAAQFDVDGRPHHTLFYTGFPNFYQLMHKLAVIFEELKTVTDEMNKKGMAPLQKLTLGGSRWVDKDVLEKRVEEQLGDNEYEQFLRLADRVAQHPWGYRHKDLLFSLRVMLPSQSRLQDIPEAKTTEDGRLYQKAEGGRKTGRASVTVWEPGAGHVSINGEDLLTAFPRTLDREQVMFPLQFTKKLGLVDFEARVENGGPSCQAGALRLALSRALQSLVTHDTVENMRLAGLLTRDPRVRERKKPGQEGARRKFTWKKR